MLFPVHSTLVTKDCNPTLVDGCVIFADKFVVQPLLSVIPTVYTPGTNPLMSSVVAPLFHKYVNGAPVPVAVKLIEPFPPPKQLTFTWLKLATILIGGCVTCKLLLSKQPFASMMVITYVPANKLLKSWVVAEVFH